MEPTGPPGRAIDRIVVGVDGSAASRAALRFAAAVAAKIGAKLRVAMSWEHPRAVALPTGPDVLATRETGDAEVAAQLRQLIRDELGDEDPMVLPVVLRGQASHSLMRFAVDPPGAALVVGTRGHGGFSDLVLGSTCRALLHDDRVPVVVVHPEHLPDRISPIVVGVDDTPGSRAAATWAAGLAARLGADVVAVHGRGIGAGEWALADQRAVATATQAELDGPWTEPITAAGVRCTTELRDEDPRQAVLRIAAEADAGLIVVGRSSGHGLARWAIGNVAESVVRHALIPVAVVSAPTGPH